MARRAAGHQIAHDARDVDRRRAQQHAAAAHLEEVDVAGVGGGQQEAQLARPGRRPAAPSTRASSVGRAAASRRPARGAAAASAQVACRPSSAPARSSPVSQMVGEPRRREPQPLVAAAHARASASALKKARAWSTTRISPRAASCARAGRGRRRAQRGLGVAHQVVDAVVADADAEVLRGDVLELVRFVDDQMRARRDHLAVGALAHRGVGAQQVVVDDHDVALGGALAHPRDEALAVARAVGAEAGLGGGRHLVPQRQVLGQLGQLGAVAGLGLRRPVLDDRQEDRVVGARGAGPHVLAAAVLARSRCRHR